MQEKQAAIIDRLEKAFPDCRASAPNTFAPTDRYAFQVMIHLPCGCSMGVRRIRSDREDIEKIVDLDPIGFFADAAIKKLALWRIVHDRPSPWPHRWRTIRLDELRPRRIKSLSTT